MFPWEPWEISENIFFAEHFRATDSQCSQLIWKQVKNIKNKFLLISGGS